MIKAWPPQYDVPIFPSPNSKFCLDDLGTMDPGEGTENYFTQASGDS
jgi:hypothetical protein